MTRAASVLGLLLLGGCATPRSAPVVSGVDLTYRLRRQRSAMSGPAGAAAPASSSVRFYQRVLHRGLGSHCSLAPSDSALAQWRFRRCGPFPAIAQSMARFYLEPDAATLALPVVNLEGRLRHVDLPDSCP